MIVNAAVFTCSICGEASVNICSYCTKDACSNHRCERCKRCSDCCECEFPLSAEEPLAGEAVVESMLQPEIESPQPEAPAPEAHEPEGPEPKAPEPQAGSSWPVFPTAEEASVFADPSALVDPRPATPDSTSPDSTTPPQDNKPAAPRW
jgi:transcription elongation factor Elf1